MTETKETLEKKITAAIDSWQDPLGQLPPTTSHCAVKGGKVVFYNWDCDYVATGTITFAQAGFLIFKLDDEETLFAHCDWDRVEDGYVGIIINNYFWGQSVTARLVDKEFSVNKKDFSDQVDIQNRA